MPRRYPRQCRQAEKFDGGFSRRRRVLEHVHAFHVGRRRSPNRDSFFRRRWGVLEVPCPNQSACSSETFRNARVLHVGRRRFRHRNSCFRRSNRCRVATPGNAGKQRGLMGVSHVGVACRSLTRYVNDRGECMGRNRAGGLRARKKNFTCMARRKAFDRLRSCCAA